MAKITVIVPVYKVEAYIHRCVDSILAQTFTDFELILVDDGSPDNCGKICDEYAEKDKRIFVIHKKNGGLSDARNAGIDWSFANSDSDYFAFVDSDDSIHPKFLERLYNAAVCKNVRLCNLFFSDMPPKYPDVIPDSEDVIMSPEQLYVKLKGAYSACSKLFHKSLFEDIRFPVGKLCEDAFTTHKLIFSCDRVCMVPCFYYNYTNDRSDSIMCSSWSPKKLDEVHVHKEQILFFIKNNYYEALKVATNVHRWACYGQIKQMDRAGVKGTKYRRWIKKELKSTTKLVKAHGVDISIRNTPDLYEFLYPRLMWCYWTFHSIVKKIKSFGR